VTTTDAGMAVPDWPSTYGYNLFLYPWTTWLAAPWDLFIEHGHRLLGALVGMMTIVLVVLLWRRDGRQWIRWLAVAALVLVILQGVLGGMRVRLDERPLAMLHGCTGPLFFAVTVALAAFTSKRWRSGNHTFSGSIVAADLVRRLAAVTCIFIYLQIVIGAVLRHVPTAAEPGTFALAVHFHLFLAAIVTFHIVMLVCLVLRYARCVPPLAVFAWMLAALLTLQLALGAGTWFVKFSLPTWAAGWVKVSTAPIQDGGWLQTHVITAHVAVGSLLLVTSLALALFAHRLLPATSTEPGVGPRQLEAAV
jgi:cytochrome c oxidase assembly protein subunit 15